MQEILMKSIETVTSDPGFLTSITTNFMTAIFIGGIRNNGIEGFKRSLFILLPYVFFIALPTVIRLFNTSQKVTLSHTAYNSIVTLIIMTIIYLVGLFIGHMIKRKAHKDAVREVSEKLGTI